MDLYKEPLWKLKQVFNLWTEKLIEEMKAGKDTSGKEELIRRLGYLIWKRKEA